MSAGASQPKLIYWAQILSVRLNLVSKDRKYTDCHCCTYCCYYVNIFFNTLRPRQNGHIEAETKWPPFRRLHFFKSVSLCMDFASDFTEVCFLRRFELSIFQHWFRHIYASLWLNELNSSAQTSNKCNSYNTSCRYVYIHDKKFCLLIFPVRLIWAMR